MRVKGGIFIIKKTKACLYCEMKEPKESEKLGRRVRQNENGHKRDEGMGPLEQVEGSDEESR